MGKGKRVKTKRKKQKINDTLQVIPLQNYPENTPTYLRHMATESGEILMEDQEWITPTQKGFRFASGLSDPSGDCDNSEWKISSFRHPCLHRSTQL